MDELLPKFFSEQTRGLIITPAGCGKTETIARAVSFSDFTKGKQLILTHTHAGVKSILDRLKKLGIPRKYYHVDTIAGFSLQYAASFPVNSKLGINFDPSTHEWELVYDSASQIFSSNIGKKIINASYCGMYVDEYQDCTKQQHSLILKLAEILPCRILGDPLQGIFGFRDNPIVNWYEDVFPHFKIIGNKNTDWEPYRWKGKNEELGKWLLVVRNSLRKGEKIDFRSLPKECQWIRLNPQNPIAQRNACLEKIINKETTVVIHHWAHQAHALAKMLNGAFTSMEEVECKDLMKWANVLENSTGADRAIKAIDFSATCMTEVSTALATIKRKIEKGDKTSKSNLQHKDIFEVLTKITEDNRLSLILDVFRKIEGIQGKALYRKELWQDMNRAITEKSISENQEVSLQKTAWTMRESGRTVGRNIDRRIVSRTLLIKGLEFDHAIVANADELNAKELYVALTRGSKSLTVFSANPVIQKDAPTDLFPPKKEAN